MQTDMEVLGKTKMDQERDATLNATEENTENTLKFDQDYYKDDKELSKNYRLPGNIIQIVNIKNERDTHTYKIENEDDKLAVYLVHELLSDDSI